MLQSSTQIAEWISLSPERSPLASNVMVWCLIHGKRESGFVVLVLLCLHSSQLNAEVLFHHPTLNSALEPPRLSGGPGSPPDGRFVLVISSGRAPAGCLRLVELADERRQLSFSSQSLSCRIINTTSERWCSFSSKSKGSSATSSGDRVENSENLLNSHFLLLQLHPETPHCLF